MEISGGNHTREFIFPQPFETSDYILEGRAYDMFTAVYGTERYDLYTHTLNKLLAGEIPKVDPFLPESRDKPGPDEETGEEPTGAIPHMPIHNIESIFWTILWFLLRAWPSDSQSESGNVFRYWANLLLNHRVGYEAGSRAQLLRLKVTQFVEILHPNCRSLAPMLKNMAVYISQKWSQYPSVPADHGHEIFKRLLLREIIRLEHNNKEIPIQGPRYIPGLERVKIKSSPLSGMGESSGSNNDSSAGTDVPKDSTAGKRARSPMKDAPEESGPRAKRQRSQAEADEQISAMMSCEEMVDNYMVIFANDRRWF